MKLFRNSTHAVPRRPGALPAALASAALCAVALIGWQARASLPRWMQDAVGASAVEAALYRVMDLPGVKALYPRPPREAELELTGLIGKAVNQSELYSLRAMEEEQALDFKAAEADWKSYTAHAVDQTGAKVELADYYHRRMQASEEVETLMEVGTSAAAPSEAYVAAAEQRSWKAFERILLVAADQRLGDAVVGRTYAAWIERYPLQPSLYAREFHWLLDTKKYAEAKALSSRYRSAFPKDEVFPVKAAALLEYRQGSADKALAVYDSGFAPLWPAELIESYYALLAQTHQQRRFLADARARLAQDPDDLNAMARLFYAAQQQGNLASARDIVEAFRISKESRKAAWDADELYTLAQLTEAIHAYPEAARYHFALYHAAGQMQAEGLSGMVRILLTAPDQSVALGAGNLSMYRDIATLDQGPGYWNGILSLWLNSTSPEQAFHEEEQRARPYFHRTKAAELLALLDKDYPQAAERAALHRQMIQAFADYGESAMVLKAGSEYLASFPASVSSVDAERDRILVAMLMADSYARQQDTKSEFTLYDRLLAELGIPSAGMPLTAAAASNRGAVSAATSEGNTEQNTDSEPVSDTAKKASAFELAPGQPAGISVPGAQAYQILLERYLGRLTATGQLSQALAVLRRELDHNPNDPALYERLASFLEQNNLSAQQEEVYQQAIQKFQQKGWYDKLARLYLREKKREAFAELTHKVTDIFHGTELENYFQQVTQGGPQLFLQLNLYAHERFPHDQVFVGNLLEAYQAKGTRDDAAWEKLLREHWADSAALRTEFFDYLNRSGKLEAEFSRLHAIVPDAGQQKANPAATRELAEAEIWRSHFEASAPLLGGLAEAYPAEEEVGSQASSVFRSLAYFDPAQTERAVTIEKHLLAAKPDDLDRLARIGDIYSDSGADATGHENLAIAAPYWQRMATLHPGSTNGYLKAATVFWDYFKFDEALQQIHEARTRFAQPHLYGYEAGAIEEGKRDIAGAIREYAAAGADEAGASSAAATRLLQLARRSASAKLVDDETARLAEHGGIAAIELRLRVLKVQKRVPEIAQLLDAALAKSATFEQAQQIVTQAQAYSLTSIYEHALARQVALATDPVQKIELSYNLAQSLEGRKQTEEAARVVESVYHDNPKLLGVVRATTDFYWRNKQPAKAIATLVEAAKQAGPAQPALADEFVVEAASKANDSGNYDQARNLMAPLLDANADPYNAQYLVVVADSYARPGDNAGLKQLYLEKLASIRDAATKLSPDERKQKTVLLRRGLIPALTRLKDYAGAVDQYVAILSAYPEDPGTIEEASLYALRYTRQPQLIAFVSNTVKASPRDSRFAIMLGQMQTTFENYPAAIDAYAHANTIRADRSDVFAAKADLEERLQRLNDACKDYEHLYKLSYQNPDWMLKIANVRARQGHKEDAVKALERAWIEGHPPTAANYFRVAGQLERWNMLEESLRFAELGVKAEGDDLLGGSAPGNQNGDDPAGVALYARLLTRMRQQEKLLTVLDEARKAAELSPNSPGVLIQQIEKQGLASVTDAEWRKQRVEQRRQTAAQRYRGALLGMGETVATYFAPEEKQQFAKLLDLRWGLAEHAVWAERSQWIDVAHAAGTLDVEARFRKQILLDRSAKAGAYEAGAPSDAQYEAYLALQRSRMEFADLGQTLEEYALLRKPEDRAAPRIAAAEAWRNAGDEAAEMRALRRISFAGNNNAYLRERYLQLLLKHDPAGFATFASSSKDEATALAAPNYAVAHSSLKVALAALNAHTQIFDAVWKSASTALLGLYFRDSSPTTEAAFHTALVDEKTIGQRVDAQGKVDRSQQLAGGVWFYYGMRYGVYRTLAAEKDWPQRDPEDFLAAGLERNPASASNYVVLARAYADAGKPAMALTEYSHALELVQDAPAVHDAMALMLWPGDQAGAIAHWRAGLTALNRIQDKGAAPESFWSNFAFIARHVGARKLTPQLRPEMDALLRNFIARNGNYRSEELLKAAYLASGSAEEGVSWILSLSAAAMSPDEVVSSFATAAWLPKESREPVLLRQVELARVAASRDAESPQSYREEQLFQVQKTLATYYFDQKQESKAEALLKQLSEIQQKDPEMLRLRIQIAARNHTLAKLLAGWTESGTESWTKNGDAGQAAPDSQLLRGVAATLASGGNKADAQALWEFVFERGQSNHDLQASDYVGLADARLQTGDLENALALLRRMTLRAGDVEVNYDLASGLLEKRGRFAEAGEFLSKLADTAPWNHSYQLRLAQARLRTQAQNSGHGGTDQVAASLRSLAGDAQADYELRTEAAMTLRRAKAGTGAGSLGGAELQLLAGGTVTAEQAEQPYFVAARMVAAEAIPDAGQRVLLLRQAISIRPQERGDFAGAGNLPLQLFQAEAEAGHPATALVLLDAMRNGNYRRASSTSAPEDGVTAENTTGDETEGSDESAAETASADAGVVDSGDDEPYEAQSGSEADNKSTLAQLERLAPLPAGSLTDAEKLALALQIAGVYEHTDSAVSALPYLELAAHLEADATRRSALLQHVDQIQMTRELEERNAQRRPSIQRALEQSTLVRPRLSAAELIGNPAREVAR